MIERGYKWYGTTQQQEQKRRTTTTREGLIISAGNDKIWRRKEHENFSILHLRVKAIVAGQRHVLDAAINRLSA